VGAHPGRDIFIKALEQRLRFGCHLTLLMLGLLRACALLAATNDEPVLELIPPPPPTARSVQDAGSLGLTRAAAVTATAALSMPVLTATAATALTATAAAQSPIAVTGSASAVAAAASALSPTAPAQPKDNVTLPGFLTAIAGNRSVLLSWYPSEGAKPVSGYLIYRGEGPQALAHAPINKQMVSDSNYSDNDAASLTGPLNRHTYYYRVRAYDVEGRLSPYSDLVSAAPNGPLLPPGRVEAQPGDGRARLTWTPPLSTGEADLARYWVLRGEASDKLAPLTSVAGTVTAWEDQGLANGKALFYALRSEDMAGKQSADSPQVRTVPYLALNPPRNLSALGVGEAVVRLKWEAPAPGGSFPLKGYNVYRSSGATVDLGRPPINKALVAADITRWEDDGDVSVEPPKLGIQYSYAMVAVDGEDEPSAPSDPSSAGPVPSITNLSPGEIPVFGDSNTLQIQGRKTINLANTWVTTGSSNQAAGVTGGFTLDQQLQVRLTGKVGRKIKVDVDYDDKAQANQQQKISVVYTGDQSEVFKEFAFGDIQMDLGAGRTEFAPYNKSLFGAKLKLESPDGKLRLTAIGAQTKGFTETKRFVGGYEQVKTGNDVGRNLPDTSFTPYKYYYLNRGDPHLAAGDGTEHIVPNSVIIDFDLPGVTNYLPQAQHVKGFLGDTLNFVRMTQGLDYLVDSNTGLVTFLDTSANRPQATTNLLVAYKYVDAYGATHSVGYNGAGTDISLGTGSPGDPTINSDSVGGTTGVAPSYSHMIQYGSQNGASKYDAHMSCQFYSLGDRDILPPASDPDFKMIVYGPNQSVIYQLDPRSDFSNVAAFDTHGGWLRFTVPYPFAKTTSGPGDLQADPPAYSKLIAPLNSSQADAYNAPARVSNFNIHIEYKHKLTSYSLRFSIIHGSETIMLDGRRLTRDQDYFLDYDSGILVFSNPDLVKDSSVVDCSYEYMPFGGQYTSTVWGARAEYDLTKDLSVGGTFLDNTADTPQDTPDIKSAPFSLQLLDGDVQFRLPQDLLDQLTRAVPGLGHSRGVLKVSAKAEMAHSWYNPNTYSRNNENGVAMVDSFESVAAIVGVSLDCLNWFPSSIPLRYVGDLGPAVTDRRFNQLVTDTNDNAHDMVARAAQQQDTRKTQLEVNYANMNTAARWDSYVFSFGPQFNQSVAASDTLELWYYTDQPITMHVDVGEVSEDAVDNQVLATESTTGILCQTCDTGILTSAAQLSPYPLPPALGGPAGYYVNSQYWGQGNAVLDTEDFDANGALNMANHYYSFTVPLVPGGGNISDGYLTQVLRDLTKPDYVIANYASDGVNLSTVQGSSDFYTRVKRVRIWFDHAAAANGHVRIETLQFTGNKWQVRADPNLLNFAGLSVTADTNKFKVAGINGNAATGAGNGTTEASPVTYVPDLNFFNVGTNNSTSLNEQALQMTYRLTSWDNSADGRPYYQARRILSTGTNVDMGGYQKLRVDIYRPTDPTNTQALPTGERLLVRMATDDQDYFDYVVSLDALTPNSWNTVTLALDGSDGQRIQVGYPYLREVNYCALAVAAGPNTFQLTNNFMNALGFQNAEVLWLDNLRVTDAITRDGGAAKATFNYDLFNGGITLTQDMRSVDSDFIMIDQQGNAPARHKITQTLDAKVNFFPKVPITLHYEDNQNFVDPANAADPLYSRNFLDPDQSDQKASGSIAVNQVPYLPGLSLSGSGYMQHIRQIFMPDAIRQVDTLQGESITPNTTQQNTHADGEAVMKVPAKAWGLGGDELHVEMDYDANSIDLDQPSLNPYNVTYRNQDKVTMTYKGRYNGSYHWGKWLSLTPSYAYSLVEATGTLPQPTVTQGSPYYVLDQFGRSEDGGHGVPQSRAINPSLVLQLGDLGPLRAPKASYNFTQTRDYIRNELRTPGSLDLSTSLNPAGAASLFKAWPAIDVTQSWQVDSVVNDDLRIRGVQRTADLTTWLDGHPDFAGRYDMTNIPMIPNIALAEQDPNWWKMWWVRVDQWNLGENVRDPMNIENIAVSSSRRSVTNATTRFDYELVKGWPASWSPHVSLTDARTMSAPEQVVRNNQFGAGLTVDLREPHIPYWKTLRPSNLNFGYDYSYADNFVEQVTADPATDENKTSNRIAHTLHVTLPTRPNDQTTLTLSVNWTASTDTNYTPSADGTQSLETGDNFNQLWEPDIRLVYFLNVDRAFKMPDFWPFYGRELKVKQAFRLDNDLDLQFKSGTQTLSNATLPQSGSNTYALRNQLSYNVLDNVKINFGIEQRLYNNLYANDAINQSGNYYSFKISLGVEATF